MCGVGHRDDIELSDFLPFSALNRIGKANG